MYLLDSDVLIDSKNRHYAFDIAPGFWDWIDRAHAAGRVFTVERCKQEILDVDDQLADWMRNRPASFAIKPSAADQAHLRKVSVWATQQHHYRQAAVNSFFGAGDYYLVGQALSLDYVVVTGEKSSPNSESRVKIPDACRGVGVPCMTLFQMLREEGARLGLI